MSHNSDSTSKRFPHVDTHTRHSGFSYIQLYNIVTKKIFSLPSVTSQTAKLVEHMDYAHIYR